MYRSSHWKYRHSHRIFVFPDLLLPAGPSSPLTRLRRCSWKNNVLPFCVHMGKTGGLENNFGLNCFCWFLLFFSCASFRVFVSCFFGTSYPLKPNFLPLFIIIIITTTTYLPTITDDRDSDSDPIRMLSCQFCYRYRYYRCWFFVYRRMGIGNKNMVNRVSEEKASVEPKTCSSFSSSFFVQVMCILLLCE